MRLSQITSDMCALCVHSDTSSPHDVWKRRTRSGCDVTRWRDLPAEGEKQRSGRGVRRRQLPLTAAVFKLFWPRTPILFRHSWRTPTLVTVKFTAKILKFLSTLLFTNKPTPSIIYKLQWFEWKANNVSVMDVLASLCTDCQFLA